MQDIIFSDNNYSRITISHLLKPFLLPADNHSYGVFIIESKYPNAKIMSIIKDCKIKNIMIICHEHIKKILSPFIKNARITYCAYSAPLSEISDKLMYFITNANTETNTGYIKKHQLSLLSRREIEILILYINGFKEISISKIFAIATKTVYSHKRNAMKKLGIQRDIDLLNFFNNMQPKKHKFNRY